MKTLDKTKILPIIGSFLISLTLWFYIVHSGNIEKTFKIPITYQNLSADIAVTEITREYVNVIISGRSDAVRKVNNKDFQAIIDLKNAKSGTTEKYPVQLIKINVPENVNVATEKVIVFVRLEKFVEELIDVEPKTEILEVFRR